jgi:hypothetical protein
VKILNPCPQRRTEMTEEELKRNITETIDDQLNHNLELICSSNYLADRILTLIRTSGLFMDTDMVKGLMFEKCVKCREKKDGQPAD